FLLLGAAPLAAQDNCPMEATRRVPLDVLHGPQQSCGGIDWQIGGVQVSTVRDSCPLYVIVTPAHDIAVTSKQRTQVEPIATLAVTKVVFACRPDYFLFFHIGSTCVFSQQLNV